VVKHNYFHCF